MASLHRSSDSLFAVSATPSDRRSFLKCSLSLAATLPLTRLRLGAAETPSATPLPGGKRGLFFDAADLPRIRANLANPRFSVINAELIGTDHAAVRKFLRDEVRLNDHITDFSRVRHLLEITALAFVVYGKPDDLETAKLALQRILDYPKWDYFLEGGKRTIGFQRAPEGTIAVCSALDWLDGHLSPEVVAEAERQVATKGAPACYLSLYGMKYPDRVRGWAFDPEERSVPMKIDFRRWPLILNATNLKIIPTAALGIAATWLHRRHPEAEKWLQLSRQSAQAFSVMYGADGAYDEGPGYSGYTTMHLAMLADVLHRRLGIDDRKLINYTGNVRYALAMAMPTRGTLFTNPNESKVYNAVPKGSLDPALDLVNFGDGGTAIDVSFAGWVARNEHDPLSQYVAENVGVVKLLHAALWYQPGVVPPEAPTAALHDVRLSNDWVVSRTGWKADDTVVAFRSGGPANHEHADRNSVLFKAYGERLFTDHFKAAYVPTHPRWVLRLTEGHTSVLINGQGHQYHDGSEGTNASWAWARVLSYQTGPGWMLVTSDATEAYQLVNDSVQQVERTLLFLKPDVLLILDRVKLATAQPVQLRFQVFSDDARGEASADANAFHIRRPYAHVQATAHGASQAIACTVGHLPIPATEGLFPFVEAVSPTSTAHEILTVCAAAPAAETAGALEMKRHGDIWQVTGAHLGRAINATLRASAGALPSVIIA
jgi:hypothetical protein